MCTQLFIVLVCCFNLLVTDVLSLNAMAWQSSKDDPEIDDFPETPYLRSRSNSAIGFSGGGSWATAVITYAQNVRNVTEFLCDIISPEQINPKMLERMDHECARRLAGADLFNTALDLLKKGEVECVAEAWAAAIQIMYLDPVGIPKGERFSWNQATSNEIKKRNPELNSSRIVLPWNESWPFPIIGSTLVGPLSNAPYGDRNHNYTRIDITPLYIGQMKSSLIIYRYLFNILKRTVKVGGVLETFAFARTGRAPKYGLPSGVQSGVILNIPAPSSIFDLQSAVGASSYAPGAFVESIPLGISDSFGMHVNYWSPTNYNTPTNYDMLFGDGGTIENIPLISFLQRKIQNSILFLNYADPLQPSEVWNVTHDTRKYGQVSDALPSYFGIFIDKDSSILERCYDYSKNQVFDEKDYPKVILALQAAQKKGNGLIASLNLTTVKNDFWGIPEGFTSKITFVYLARLSSWEEKLSPDMQKLVKPPDGSNLADDIKTGPFEGFPHYTTLAGGINAERANLLGNMVGWSVLENEELFRSLCE